MSKRNTLVKNIFSLSGIQVINYIIPVLIVPYIVRIIGPSSYGLINFAQGITAYFIIIVNYSYDLSATREVSLNRNNKDKLSEIFSSVLFSKIILFLVTSLIYFPLICLIPRLKTHFILFLFSYLIIVGNILLPIWLFQGLEKLSRLSIFYFLVKLLYALLILTLIRDAKDYILIPLILSISQLVVGFTAFLYAIKIFKVSLIFINKNQIKKSLTNGWNLFLSSISTNIYASSNIVILGLFSSNLNVGYFSAASKIIIVIQSLLLVPMNQSFFPRISNLMNNKKEQGIIVLKNLTFFVGIIMFFASLLIFLFSDIIINIVFGSKFIYASQTLKIMAFLPFVIGLNNVFGIQGLINLKMDKQFLIVTFVGAMISIVLNLILVPIYFENGTAISWLLTEIFIMVSFFITLRKNNILLFDWEYFKSYLTRLKEN